MRDELRTAAIGCWELRGLTGERAEGSLYWAPSIARLTDLRPASPWATSFPLYRDVVRLDSLGRDLALPDPRGKRGWAVWAADTFSDSIRIGFSSGFSGSWFVFSLPTGKTADTLHGRAYEHWDYQPETPRGRATAIAVRCPSGN
ncbi:MAG: hypothetical protein ABJB74_09745 [Gemmatimonas sp.]